MGGTGLRAGRELMTGTEAGPTAVREDEIVVGASLNPGNRAFSFE
jgi:hypothetical protein